jgi:hypothetical protein
MVFVGLLKPRLSSIPFLILSLMSVPVEAANIVAGWHLSCAAIQGKAACWGTGGWGASGLGTQQTVGFAPGQMAHLLPINFRSPSLEVDQVVTSIMGGPGYEHTCVLFTIKIGLCFGYNNWGESGVTENGGQSPLLGPPNIIEYFTPSSNPVDMVVAVDQATCVLSNGDVTCWGAGGTGTLGLGERVNSIGAFTSSRPISFSSTLEAISISGIHDHVCALFSNKRARCWGNNDAGQLGQGHQRTVGLAPSDMSSLPFISFSDATATIKQVSAGGSHTCALFERPAGEIVCWGSGDSGRTGTGSYNSTGGQPSDLTSLPYITFSCTDPATGISAGYAHSCAVFSQGGIRCWGVGGNGRLGTNSENNVGGNPSDMSSLPFISFSDSQPAVQVSAGFFHSCAVFAGTYFRCWGSGEAGTLGYDSTDSKGGSPGSMSMVPYIDLLGLIPPKAVPASGSTRGGEYITASSSLLGRLNPTPSSLTLQFTSSSQACKYPVNVTGIILFSDTNNDTFAFTTPAWPCPPGEVSVLPIPLMTSFPFFYYDPTFRAVAIASPFSRGGEIRGGAEVALRGVNLTYTPDAKCRFSNSQLGPNMTDLTVTSDTTAFCTSPDITNFTHAPFSAENWDAEIEIALNGIKFTSGSGLATITPCSSSS